MADVFEIPSTRSPGCEGNFENVTLGRLNEYRQSKIDYTLDCEGYRLHDARSYRFGLRDDSESRRFARCMQKVPVGAPRAAGCGAKFRRQAGRGRRCRILGSAKQPIDDIALLLEVSIGYTGFPSGSSAGTGATLAAAIERASKDRRERIDIDDLRRAGALGGHLTTDAAPRPCRHKIA